MNTLVHDFVFSPFQENTYVLYDETKECVIIDPGCYEKHERDELKEFIENNELKPVLLLNTHSHLDHIFGNSFVQQEWGLTPHVHPKDQPVYESFEATVSVYQIPNCDVPPEPIYDLQEGDHIRFGNTVLETHFLPGHSPGHVAFECEKSNFVVVGDVLFNGSIGRTDLPGGRTETLMKSIHDKLLKLDLDRKVYCGHGPTTTLKEEKENNPFLR